MPFSMVIYSEKSTVFFIFFSCVSRCLSRVCAARAAPAPQVVGLQGLTNVKYKFQQFRESLLEYLRPSNRSQHHRPCRHRQG